MATRILDLRGEVCPYTFVRTKIAMEDLAIGDELTIVLDHRPAFKSVPRALLDDGYEVRSVQPSEDNERCVIIAGHRPSTPP